MKPLEVIKRLVENGFNKQDLENELYHNNELISYLEGITDIPKYSNEVSAYHELLTENFSDKSSHLNIQDIFEEILKNEGVDFKNNTTLEEEIDFIDNATPSWIPNEKEYISKLYDDNKPISKKEFKELLLEHFKCLKKRPKWLQDPDWIIDEKPLVFAGQIDVSPLYHDTTYLYMFFNPKDGSYSYLTQSM